MGSEKEHEYEVSEYFHAYLSTGKLSCTEAQKTLNGYTQCSCSCR